MRWVQSKALVRLPIDLAAQMRAQALGGKLKKGEFRIGRISLSALVQVRALTRSRAVPNIAIQRVPMLHAALYGVVPLAADRGGERAEHPHPVQRDRLARRLEVPPSLAAAASPAEPPCLVERLLQRPREYLWSALPPAVSSEVRSELWH